MSLKEILYRSLMIYFILVTCITAGIMILGLTFDPDAKFGYSELASPFIFAALGVIPNLLMYSSKELSDRQIILRKMIQFVVIEAEIAGTCIISPIIHTEKPEVMAGVMISVLVIFIFVHLIRIMNNYFSAKQLTRELMKFQKKIKL
ncbi:MAG: hypothetical protein NC180_04765 [Muribaculaceae bacterium]|nr:hypothetical protein [Roseburia sp.]MCM1431099.1 hypothetical protein [Muribaculaceae bacterium]MCM1492522.1 hypothetical protein [Muribaculaceae bacterium]